MPIRLNEKEQRVLSYVARNLSENGYPPSVRDIARDLQFKSTSTVQMYLDRLVAYGYLQRQDGKSRTLRLVHSEGICPLFHTITEDEIVCQGTLSLPGLPGGDLFAYPVPDMALADRGVLAGDYALIERNVPPRKEGLALVASGGKAWLGSGETLDTTEPPVMIGRVVSVIRLYDTKGEDRL